jgi:hypothetical protein
MLSKYKLNKGKDNLRHFYESANEEDKLNGINWYSDFNIWCTELADKYGYDNATIAAIFSALSPRNKLEKNKIDTIAVLDAVRDGVAPDDIKVSTFHNNKYKAFNIAYGVESIKKASPKTFAFMMNVGYLNESYVTVDVWHMRAFFNRMIAPKSLTPKVYKQIEKATIEVAEEYGIKGYELQAVVWENIRNNG